MGRLTRDPEIKYSNSQTSLPVAKFTLAVNRRFKRNDEHDADFINCVAFGKSAELAEKYLNKGKQISIVGRLQVSSWNDKNGMKRWSTDVIVEENYFTESMTSSANRVQNDNIAFYPIDENETDDNLLF